ncbi:hypothetical protein V8E36_008709 [Tilletia maclaganii]
MSTPPLRVGSRSSTTRPWADQGNGWAPPPCISKAYDVVLWEALTILFKLLIYNLLGVSRTRISRCPSVLERR